MNHRVTVHWIGVVPYGYCETCEWEGDCQPNETTAANDARLHALTPGNYPARMTDTDTDPAPDPTLPDSDDDDDNGDDDEADDST